MDDRRSSGCHNGVVESGGGAEGSGRPAGRAPRGGPPDEKGLFVVANNPDADSSLPYLIKLPLDEELILKAGGMWPRSSRIYCHRVDGAWPEQAVVVESVPVVSCRRRGAAVDLVLDRAQLARSQFVFTEVRGRAAIFWQTQSAARRANPGARVPKARTIDGLTITVDTRERYPYRFANREVDIERAALPAGDYAVTVGGEVVASVERKTIENLTGSLSDATLSFQMQRLAELPLAAVVIEGRYADLFRQPGGRAGWLADVLSRLQVRYPEVAIVFADSRKLAEEWTYRYLASAMADHG